MKNLKKRILTILALLFAPTVLADTDKREDYLLEKGCYHINMGGNFLQFCLKEESELLSIKEGDIIPFQSVKEIDGVWKNQATTHTHCQSVEIKK